MSEPLVAVSVVETEDPAAEVKRLRFLLEQAEAHARCRFAMISFHEQPDVPPILVLTTSATEVTAMERHLLAAAAPAVFDRRAAWEAGVAQGIAEVCNAAFGGVDKAPAKWRKRIEKLAKSVVEATIGSIELTRIQVAPFGLELSGTDDGAAVFTRVDRSKPTESDAG